MNDSVAVTLGRGAINFSGKNLNIGVYDNVLKGEGQDARSINFSGKNLNIGVYDNGLKGEGQDAEVIERQFSIMSG